MREIYKTCTTCLPTTWLSSSSSTSSKSGTPFRKPAQVLLPCAKGLRRAVWWACCANQLISTALGIDVGVIDNAVGNIYIE